MSITKDITIEELVETIPASVKYLMNEGIKCIACGEPIWGTLDEAAKEKGFNDGDIVRFVGELNELANAPSDAPENVQRINVDKLKTND